MSFFNKVSIKRKLIIVFVFWLIIFIAFAVFSYIDLDHLWNTAKYAYDIPVKFAENSTATQSSIIDSKRIIQSSLYSKNNTDINFYQNEINTCFDNIFNLTEEMDKLNDNMVSENQIQNVKIDLQKLSQMKNDFFSILLSGNKNNLENKLKEYNDEADRITNMLKSYKAQAEDVLNTDVSHLDEFKSKQKIILLLLVLFIIVMIIFSIIYILISVLGPINKLKKTMFDSVQTGRLCEAKLKGFNEVVEMAMDYNILVRSLKDMFWIKDAINNLSTELSNSSSVYKVANTSLNFICRALNIGNGVCYLYYKDIDKLILRATFSPSEKYLEGEMCSLGEGVVGQVAIDKKPISLEKVPNSNLTIKIGIANVESCSMYCYPILFENSLYGVIQLISYKPLANLEKQFIKEMVDVVGINLHSAFKNKELKTALKVTKETQLEYQNTADELQKVNQMLEHQQRLLQQQAEELQQSNAQMEEQHQQLVEQARLLSIQNQDLKKSRKELVDRSKQLEQANKYKSEFLANMSHELRTPLNSIILLSRLLLENSNSNPNETEKLDVIYKAGQELLRLINDILDLSKIESGRMDLNLEVFNTNKLIDELSLMFTSIAKEKNIDLKLIDRANVDIRSDKDKVSQILRNLLSNAIKFTENGCVSIEISRKGPNGLIFAVKDTGIGILKDQIPVIFGEFQQGDGSISRKYGGTGLGLTISQKLANLIDGEIIVKSELKKGSTFTLYLKNCIYDKLNINKNTIANEYKSDLKLPEPVENQKSQSDKLVILIVDNDQELTGYIVKQIEKLDLKYIICKTGREGLLMAKKEQVDAILLDIALPDMSGVEVLKELKSTVELQNIPVQIIDDRNLGQISEFISRVKKEEFIETELYTLTKEECALSLQKKRIMIVDDDAKNVFVLASALENYDAEIVAAENGKVALQKLQNEKIDLILMDIMMPEVDGYETIKAIRSNEKLKDIPIIAVTAKSLKGDRQKCLSVGANDYISKPVDYDTLVRIIKAWINK